MSLDGLVVVHTTYRSWTENAKMTVAFSRSLMRSDDTNSSEIPKMKISSAIAVSSTPFHKRHCFLLDRFAR
jgi:hypothetical protein